MKVHLKITVIDRIITDMVKARRDQRGIEFISVTPAEFVELRHDQRSTAYFQTTFDLAYHLADYAKVAERVMKTRNFKCKAPRSYHHDQIVVACEGTFQGIDLYVVPEYCET